MTPFLPTAPIGSQPTSRPGTITRAFVQPPDQLPQDARVDWPEIQTPWRVSFSDGARVQERAARQADSSARSETGLTWQALQARRAYLAVAALLTQSPSAGLAREK